VRLRAVRLAPGGVVNVITRDIRPGFHAAVRALGGTVRQPTLRDLEFPRLHRRQGRARRDGSYGTDHRAGTYGRRWHSDGYREQTVQPLADRGKASGWDPGNPRHRFLGSWVTTNTRHHLSGAPAPCDDRGRRSSRLIEAAGRGALTRSDKGTGGTVEHSASEGLAGTPGPLGRTHFTISAGRMTGRGPPVRS